MQFLRAVEALDRKHDGIRRFPGDGIQCSGQVPGMGCALTFLGGDKGMLVYARLPDSQDAQQQQGNHRHDGIQDGNQAGMLIQVGDKGLYFRNFFISLDYWDSRIC
jgi:hypothetical protein